MDQGSVDLRLLECLQTLVAERHVTRAAERLGMTQPMLSSALARLRKTTGDPLLVRTPQGMVPTDVARELASSAHEFLLRWSSLVHRDAQFRPESSVRIFRVQTPDLYSRDFVNGAIAEMVNLAPGASVAVSAPVYGSLWDRLETGEIDLAIGGFFLQIPQELFISQLKAYELCCIVSSKHPRIRDRLELESYARERHAVLSFGGQQAALIEKYVDDWLTERGRHRRIAAFLPSLLSIPSLVASTDLVSLVPKQLAAAAAKHLPLQLLDPPLDLPQVSVMMVWHARTKNDAANQWFRELIRRVARSSD
jgi:DNA-binding transcriptional LysR family regulator